jgi:hypothetical protein
LLAEKPAPPPHTFFFHANRRLAERSATHPQHVKLGGKTIQIQADAVEVGVGGALGRRGGVWNPAKCGCRAHGRSPRLSRPRN